MEEVSKNILMEILTMEIIKWVKLMEKGYTSGIMEKFMMGSGAMD